MQLKITNLKLHRDLIVEYGGALSDLESKAVNKVFFRKLGRVLGNSGRDKHICGQQRQLLIFKNGDHGACRGTLL